MEDQTSVVRKRRHLSPEEKFQIFMEAIRAKENGSVGEVLRRWRIHSSGLVRIRRTVEQSSLGAFRERKSRKPKVERTMTMKIESLKQALLTLHLKPTKKRGRFMWIM